MAVRQSRRASPHCWCNCDFHGLSREAELSSPVFTLAMTSRIADGTVDQRQRLTFDTLSETIYSSSGSVSPANFVGLPLLAHLFILHHRKLSCAFGTLEGGP